MNDRHKTSRVYKSLLTRKKKKKIMSFYLMPVTDFFVKKLLSSLEDETLMDQNKCLIAKVSHDKNNFLFRNYFPKFCKHNQLLKLTKKMDVYIYEFHLIFEPSSFY